MQSVPPLSIIFDTQGGNGDSTKSLPLKYASGMGSSNNMLASSKGGKKMSTMSMMGEKSGKGTKITNFFSSKKKSSTTSTEVADGSRNVFGVTLERVIAVSRISDTLELPAVIYRCIEYLEGKEGFSLYH